MNTGIIRTKRFARCVHCMHGYKHLYVVTCNLLCRLAFYVQVFSTVRWACSHAIFI